MTGPSADSGHHINPTHRTSGGLSLAGGTISLVCFFLPWMQVSCMGQTKTVSGSELAQQSGIIWLVLIAAIVIVASALYFRGIHQPHKARPLVLAAAGTALAILVLKYLQLRSGIDTEMGRISAQLLQLSFRIGALGTAGGFVLAAYDATQMAKSSVPVPAGSRDGVESGPLAFETVISEARKTFAETTASAVPTVQAAAATLNAAERRAGVAAVSIFTSFIASVNRSLAWSRSHRIAVAGFALAALGALAALFVLKPKPESDARRVAEAYEKCALGYRAQQSQVYGTFLAEFANNASPTRSAASAEIERRMSDADRALAECNLSADAEYASRQKRWISAGEKLAAYESALFASRANLPADTSSLGSQVAVAIQGIRPPLPDVQRTVTDLIGRSVDGWNFAYLSEIKDSKIEETRKLGDSVEMRMRLSMEDYNTHTPYSSVIFVKYVLGADSWNLSSLRELLLTSDSTVNYFVNGNLFPVGRWRFGDHYATFDTNGFWTGKWDNGSEASGEWRIVNGNLIRTANGSTWQSAKILSFTQGEIILDGGFSGSVRAERVN